MEDADELITANEMAELIAADDAAAEEEKVVAATDDVVAAVPTQPRFSGLEGMIGFQG